MNEIIQAILELSGQIKTLEEKLTKRIDDVEEKLTKRIDDVEEKLNKRINDLDEKFTHRMDQSAEKIDLIDAKLSVLSENLLKTQAEVKVLKDAK